MRQLKRYNRTLLKIYILLIEHEMQKVTIYNDENLSSPSSYQKINFENNYVVLETLLCVSKVVISFRQYNQGRIQEISLKKLNIIRLNTLSQQLKEKPPFDGQQKDPNQIVLNKHDINFTIFSK